MLGRDAPNYDNALECLDRVINKIKPETSSKMRSAVVALYSSDYDNRVRFAGQICLLHLDFDRHMKAYFLRFYHLEYLSLLLEVELYYGFMDSYREKDKTKNLWGFDLWRLGTICIQFRNEVEAQVFAKKLELYAPKMETLDEMRKKQAQERMKQQKGTSFFGKIKNIFKKPQKEKEESVVLEVVKSNSVCIDKQGNFQTKNMSPEWEEILRRSGLNPEDMKDKAIAQLVMEETIIFEAKKAAEADPTILYSAGIKCIQELEEPEDTPYKNKEKQVSQEVLPSESGQIQKASQEKEISPQTALMETPLPPLPPQIDLPLPPPPPPIGFLPPPPSLSPLPNPVSLPRQNLLEQIRNNNIKLKPVKTNGQRIQIDASSFNRQERIDLSQQIRKRLQARKAALNRQHCQED